MPRDLDLISSFDLQFIIEPSGSLTVCEFKDIDWSPKRFYMLSNVSPDNLRGGHAHTKLNQIYFSINGEWEIEFTNGKESRLVSLKSFHPGIFIPAGFWRTIRSKSIDSILGVLASSPYDETEYIRNYSDYLEWCRYEN